MRSFIIELIVLISVFSANEAFRFLSLTATRKCQRPSCFASKDDLGGNVASRGLFGVVEALGKLTSTFLEQYNTDAAKKSSSNRPKSTEDIAKLIQAEYEAIFWATGNTDMALFADDCTFADPFSSFGGPGSRDRFKKNADNLGKLVLNPTIKLTSLDINVGKDEEGKNTNNIVKVGWIFSSKLNLPWRPVLAAAGETSHYLDDQTGLIVRYEERWKSNPWDVVKRLFVPSNPD